MSLSEVKALAVALTVAAALGAVSGCTVQPLYGSGGGSFSSPQSSVLSTVSVEQVNTREAQQVRNHLIFLLGGGSGEPASPAYKVRLGVSSQTQSSASVQPAVAIEREPTAGRVVMTSAYELVDLATGQVIASGKRQASASFDKSRQEFAIVRAERDAQDRAARELAETLHLTIAQELLKR